MFIAIEGIDGCGKTTQVGLLLQRLGAKYLKFPDPESPTGKLIYGHLKEEWCAVVKPLECPSADGDENEDRLVTDADYVNALMFQCLHFANRLERAEEICTLRAEGRDIITDRYLASAVAYGSADGLEMEYLIKSQAYLPQPDINILLDIDPSISEARRPERRDRYEKAEGYLERVAGQYRKVWSLGEPPQWIVLNGNRAVVEVQADIITAVKRWQAVNKG